MPEEHYDLAIVGAGFGGLYMLHRARRMGLAVRVFERGDGIGGVWHFNRYPGARCDVESVDYSYSFDEELQQEWHWSERYASQPEILRYIEHVADRFGLREDIQLETEIAALDLDEQAGRWRLHGADGPLATARFCVMATGSLSIPRVPEFAGLEDFGGEQHHTADWPSEPVDFAGRRVGVIGTGSSGTQVIPLAAELASQLYVFQRTPNFTVPAQHGPMQPGFEREVKAHYAERRRTARETASGLYMDMSRISALEVSDDERRAIYEEHWRSAGFGFIQCFSDLLLSKEANDTVVAFIQEKIAAQLDDPAVADRLIPRNHPYGTKRPCVASDFYPTFNRGNVTLVDIGADAIETFTASGLRLAGGGEYALDMVVLATGFDAMTGALSRLDLRGVGGVTLAEKWAAGPRTYLGLAAHGFPNLFVIAGPGSPSVLTNVVVSIEQHVDWIIDLLEHVQASGIARVEATAEAEADWVEHVNALAASTLYPDATSWYLGDNVPGKPRVFMPYPGGLRRYRRRCDAIAEAGYEGFELTPASQPAERLAG